jgi:2-iminobutanoate/2-iminopropanoate deaminase
MAIKRTTSGPGLPGGFPFSLAGEVNGVCFISGMPALTPDGRYREGTFEEEVSLAWRNVAKIARASGYTVEEIVYVQCALADLEDYGALNNWWRQQFPEVSEAPARFTFQAGALPFGCKVELQAVAGRAR